MQNNAQNPLGYHSLAASCLPLENFSPNEFPDNVRAYDLASAVASKMSPDIWFCRASGHLSFAAIATMRNF